MPLKLVLVYMEYVLRILDRNTPHMLGAVQALGVAVLEYADRLLLGVWDTHIVRSARCNVGRPVDLRAAHPHAGGRRTLQPGVDYVGMYEAASQRRLRREPRWAAARDPLYGNPARQAQRSVAVTQAWGSVALAWADVLHNAGRGRFIPAYLVYLSFT